MEFGFLFWLFFLGIVVASLQDLKRREVDNWLNLFLFVSSLVFVLYGSLLVGDLSVVLRVVFLLIVMGIIMNLFYYGRVFAGGDAKLLFAMSVFFLGVTFSSSMINVGVFVFFLMVSGSFYGLCYSGVLWSMNRKKVNAEMALQIKGRSSQFAGIILLSLILLILGFVNFIFLLIGICLFVFPFLYVFAKGLENVSMIREVSGKELREGDWLVHDVVVRSQVAGRRSQVTIKANWDGLSLEEIEILKRKKKVLIKEGLPFVPAFLIAFLSYVFLKDWFLGFLIRGF